MTLKPAVLTLAVAAAFVTPASAKPTLGSAQAVVVARTAAVHWLYRTEGHTVHQLSAVRVGGCTRLSATRVECDISLIDSFGVAACDSAVVVRLTNHGIRYAYVPGPPCTA